MARAGRGRGAIVFMGVWLVVWTAGILIVLVMLGGGLMSGDYGAAPFLLLWLAFAGFGLYAGIRRMQALLRLGPPPEGPGAGDVAPRWNDGMPRRPASHDRDNDPRPGA